MATQKQIAANRRNAQRSSGPRTPAGKAASARNATRHGVLSQNAVSPYEDRKAYDALLARLVEEHQPETTLECMLVERLVNLFWREKRLADAEALLITRRNQEADDLFHIRIERALSLRDQHLIGRYQGMLGRQITDTLRDLRAEQKRRMQTIEHGQDGAVEVEEE